MVVSIPSRGFYLMKEALALEWSDLEYVSIPSRGFYLMKDLGETA